jgi:outer membrane protein assembly factor BamB
VIEPLQAGDPRSAGEFRLRARLGAGGMGQVFLGYSPGGRAVAVKVCHPEFAADPAFVRRFALEVDAARAVNGLYTAQVIDAGPDDIPPWLATSYVPGPSLYDAVRGDGPLPAAAVWRLAGGLAEALQAVHARGLVHRDLKPTNVLLAADGPRVIDFGVARALDGTSMTTTGITFGTASYMSPEQAGGEEIGPASDVFALGCVLCFAATGGVPFGDGDPPAVLYRVIYAPPELGAVPAGLRDLVAACLVKNPAERLTLPQVLRACAAAESAGRAGDRSGSASFWPGPVAALIARYEAGLTGQVASLEPAAGEPTGGVDGSLGARLRSRPPATVPPARPPGTIPPTARTDRAPGGLSRRRALTGLAGVAAAAGLGVASWKLAGPGRGRGDPQGRRAAHGPGSLLWSQRTGGQVTSGAARAGRAVYIGSDDGHVYALNALTGRRIRTFAFDSAVTSAVTVAQGALFAATADGKLHARPVTGGGPGWKRALGVPAGGWPVVTNGVVYVGADDGAVYALHAAAGKAKWHYQTGGPVHLGPLPGSGSFSTQVYAASDDGHVYALDTDAGAFNWRFPLRAAASSGLAQADPAGVFVGDEHGTLYQLDAETGTDSPTNWQRSMGGAVRGRLAVRHDTLYAGAASGSVHAVNIYGDALWSYPAGSPVNSGLAVSGGTLYAGSEDGYLHAINVSTGTKRWRYRTGGAVRSQILVAGGVVYFGSLDGSVYAVRA